MAKLGNTDISMMDVRNILGEPSLDLGTLCQSNKINIWSKYKPVRHNFTTNRPSEWWRGVSGNCGINVVKFSTISDLINAVEAGTNVYSHDKPVGGTLSPYRLGDFAGYDSSALPPLIAGNFDMTVYKNVSSFGMQCMMARDSDEQLSASDVYGNALSNTYYGVAFVQAGNNSSMWMTNSSTTNYSILIPTSSFATNTTYYAYQFLTAYHQPAMTTVQPTNEFILLPNTTRSTIKFETTNIHINILNVTCSGSSISGTIRIKNETGSQVSFSNVYLLFRYVGSNDSDPFINGESQKKLDNISVNGNQTLDIPFSYDYALVDVETKGGKVILYANNKKQTQTYIMMKPEGQE